MLLRQAVSRSHRWVLVLVFFALCSSAFADSISVSGNLPNNASTGGTDPDAVVLVQFSLSTAADISVQSFGYGGGTNAAGTTFTPDETTGTDFGFVSELVLYDAGKNVIADYYAPLNADPGACDVGNANQYFGVCGDARVVVSLANAGDYTLAIMANPNAPAGGTLADGFTTGGSLIGLLGEQRTGFYAVDITSAGITPAVPEPASLLLMLSGGVAMGLRRSKWMRRGAVRK